MIFVACGKICNNPFVISHISLCPPMGYMFSQYLHGSRQTSTSSGSKPILIEYKCGQFLPKCRTHGCRDTNTGLYRFPCVNYRSVSVSVTTQKPARLSVDIKECKRHYRSGCWLSCFGSRLIVTGQKFKACLIMFFWRCWTTLHTRSAHCTFFGMILYC